MLNEIINEIITVYAITDDLLKAIRHHEDCRREMSDAEIINVGCFTIRDSHISFT